MEGVSICLQLRVGFHGLTLISLFTRAEIFDTVVFTQCDFLRDYRGMQERAESLIALSHEHGFSYHLAVGLLRLGRIEVEKDPHAGIETMLEAMRLFRERGQSLTVDCGCWALAEAYLTAGRMKEGMAVLDEAIKSSAAHEQRLLEAEMRRLKGEFLLLSGNRDDAERSMREAIAIARQREAKSWELRATVSLARLLRDTGRCDEARVMLAKIYGWFTEGFDTADLKDAEALLDELSA